MEIWISNSIALNFTELVTGSEGKISTGAIIGISVGIVLIAAVAVIISLR